LNLNVYNLSPIEWALTLMGWGRSFTLSVQGERPFKLHAVPGHSLHGRNPSPPLAKEPSP